LYLNATPLPMEDSFSTWRTLSAHGNLPPFKLKNLSSYFRVWKAYYSHGHPLIFGPMP
jgi:hypothetical protein